MNTDKNNTQLPQSSVSVSAGLSGKSKVDFEKWLENKDVAPYKVMFYDIPKIVQHAYIIEWLDSVEIYIHSFPRFYKLIKYSGKSCYPEIEIESKKYFKDRTLANLSAIKKAVKIYNTEAEH
ncbi:hypothetical protein ACNQF7_10285 [Flavobacterium sp. RSP29]|uniref:hypothetical protein n=1 Tax=Flavobacterium sp. RSP29 TaxID=3401731 RepID=UPI003AAFB5A0